MQALSNPDEKRTVPAELVQQAENNLTRIFNSLKATHLGWRANIKTQAEYDNARREWLRLLLKHRLTAREIQQGLDIADVDKNPFLPSFGQFLDWCKSGNPYAEFGLPSEDELLERTKKFSRCGGLAWVDKFDFTNDLEYHLLTKLHERAEKNQWGEKEFRQGVKAMLAEWAEKLSNGEPIPPRRKQLPKQVKVKATEEQVSAHLAKMKAMFKGIFDDRSTI